MNIKMSQKGHSRAEQRAHQPEVEERCIHRLYPQLAVNRFTMAKLYRRELIRRGTCVLAGFR
jgi:hypothetical protein